MGMLDSAKQWLTKKLLGQYVFGALDKALSFVPFNGKKFLITTVILVSALAAESDLSPDKQAILQELVNHLAQLIGTTPQEVIAWAKGITLFSWVTAGAHHYVIKPISEKLNGTEKVKVLPSGLPAARAIRAE